MPIPSRQRRKKPKEKPPLQITSTRKNDQSNDINDSIVRDSRKKNQIPANRFGWESQLIGAQVLISYVWNLNEMRIAKKNEFYTDSIAWSFLLSSDDWL